MNRVASIVVIFGLLALSLPVAHAQWAVIDVAALARLTTEVQTLEQSLVTEQQQFSNAQRQLQAMTGSRGMQNLLSGVRRNYLPQNWTELTAAENGAASQYPSFTASIQADVAAQDRLAAAEAGQLSPGAQAQLRVDRQTAALLQAVSTDALSNSSGRFADLRQLISAIGGARDQKAILDLTARIAAEQAMLQNEQTKLRVLFASAQAQEWMDRERAREGAIMAQGNFATRFQPTP
jgi:type IV secretion system protein VirB5